MLFQNIKNAIQFLLSGNFAAILAVLYASLASLPVPFAPVHLLFINLLTDSLPAIALGLEPHNPEVMHHFWIMRLQSKRDRRQAVCQKVDEQQMYRCKWNRQTCK